MVAAEDRTITPNFGSLHKAVNETFVSSATWLPNVFSYWARAGVESVDSNVRHVVARRSEYLAYPSLELAKMHSDTDDGDLNIFSSYSPSMVATGITVTEEDWATHSAFLVICFEPDVLDQKCYYSRWTGLECQVVWGNKVSYTKTAPFSSHRTSIIESVAERGAELFVEFLNAQFA